MHCILAHMYSLYKDRQQIAQYTCGYFWLSNINNMSKQLNAKSGRFCWVYWTKAVERFGQMPPKCMCVWYSLDAKVSMKKGDYLFFTNHLHFSCSRNFQSNDDSDGDDVFFIIVCLLLPGVIESVLNSVSTAM